MTQYTFTAEQRSDFRKAITSAPAWDLYRTVNNITASSMSVEDMLKAAQELNINPADYGTAKGEAKPRPYDSAVFAHFKSRFNAIPLWAMSYQDMEKAAGILMTCESKQDSRMTEAQYNRVRLIVEAGEREVLIRGTEVKTEAPAPAPVVTDKKDPAQLLADLAEALGQGKQGGLTETQVINLIDKHAPRASTVTIDLRTHEAPRFKEGALLHYKAPLLISAVSAKVNVMLVGPAGSGKTTAAEQTAEALGVPFYFTGAIDSPYKLTGFIDAQGRTVRTPFREAYERGAVFLFDEMDASASAAVLAFNAALSNGHMDFPDGVIKRHKDFYAIAACNTYGSGASRQYVGRTQQDSAALDRYATLVWDYDSALEAALIGLEPPKDAPKPQNIKPRSLGEVQTFAQRWLDIVTQARKTIESHGIRHIVSPRASVMGTRLFSAGWDIADIKEAVLFKGLDADSRQKISA
jgi:hypothetical protein